MTDVSGQTESPLRWWLPRIFAATTGGVLLAATLDLGLLPFLRGDPAAGDWLGALYLLALSGLAGVFLAFGLAVPALLALLLGGRRPPALRNPGVILVSLAFTAWLIHANRTTFDGARIREHALLPLLKIGSLVVALVAPWLTVTLLCRVYHALRSRSAWLGLPVAASAFAAAAGFYFLDATQLVGHYPQLHWQLAIATILAAALGLLALDASAGSGRGRRLLLRLAIVLIIAAPLLRLHGDLPSARATLVTRSVHARQWMAHPETLLDRIIALPEVEAADVSRIVDARLADQRAAKELGGRLDGLIPKRREMNLLVLSLDTVRQDRLSYTGYARKTSPELDALADRSLVFEQSYTAYPTSSYAYSALFTGRYPSCAPVTRALEGKKTPSPPGLALADLLRRAGWKTAAVSAFNRETLDRREVFGHLKDGFESFNPRQTLAARLEPDVTRSALTELKRLQAERFFLWVHYLDPHAPYTEHERFGFGKSPSDRYDSEIAVVDGAVGRLLGFLKEAGLEDRTVVVVMSDHGEEFQEHFGRHHNSSLYEQQVRVPLLVHVPGFAARRLPDVTSLADLVPTLTTLFDLEDPHQRNGRDLWPTILGEADHAGYAFAELRPMANLQGGVRRMLRFGRHKLIVDEGSATEELYDVLTDAAERKNLVGEAPPELPVLRGLLRHCREEIAAIRGERVSEETPRSRRQKKLDGLISDASRLEGASLHGKLLELQRLLQDAVFGIDRDYRPLLDGPSGDALRRLLDRLLASRDAVAVHSAVSLAWCLGERSVLPRLAPLQPLAEANPRLYVELLTMRAYLGERVPLELLQGLAALPGAPYPARVAMARLDLGDPGGLDVLLAGCHTRRPFEVSRLIRSLGRARRPELLELADLLFAHRDWQFAPVREALVDALADFPPSPEKNRLLVRLGNVFDPRVSAAAQKALEGLPAEALSRLRTAGRSEAETDDSLLHRRFPEALQSMERAAAHYPAGDPGPRLKLARMQHTLGKPEAARATLESLDPGSLDEATRASVGRRKGAFPDSREIETGAFPFSIVEAPKEIRALPVALGFVPITLRNDGPLPWPGHRVGDHLSLRLVLIPPADAAEKTPVDQPAVLLGRDDLAPQETRRLLLPFNAPRDLGRWTLGVRLVRHLASGRKPPPDPVQPLDTMLEVTARLR